MRGVRMKVGLGATDFGGATEFETVASLKERTRKPRWLKEMINSFSEEAFTVPDCI